MPERITSLQNPKVKLVRRLRNKRDRERENMFVVDSERDLARAIACDYEVEFVFQNEDDSTAQPAFLDSISPDKVIKVPANVIEKASYRQNPTATVAVLHEKPSQQLQVSESIPDLILALVGLTKPGNIGALIRTADALGVQTVFLVDTDLDIYNPNIIRNSAGAVFSINLYVMDRADAVTFFQTMEFQTVSGHLEGAKAPHEINFMQRTAILLGTEDRGLDAYWTEHSDQLVKIPMLGEVTDSLNVSVSGAILMYEALRQKQLS